MAGVERIAIILTILACLGLAPGSRRAQAQIPPGYEIVQITDDDDYDDRISLNSCGQIAFSKRVDQSFDGEEIFLYEPTGELIRITNDNVRDAFPDINDNGTIVWSRAVGPGGTFEIAMYRDGEITILTDNDVNDVGPAINSLDHVTWKRYTGEGCTGMEIFFYDGQTIQQITDNGFSNQGPRINDLDEIAWTRYDFCVNPWVGTIMLYSAGQTIELSDGMGQDQGVDINYEGQVAWAIGYPEAGIALWDNGEVEVVTSWGAHPRLNNFGDIIFQRWHEDAGAHQEWVWLDGMELQLTDESVNDLTGDMNDCGEVAWVHGDFPQTDLWWLRMISGDATTDGVVDLADFGTSFGCLSGPQELIEACLCRRADFDRDQDVDLRDMALFQNVFLD